MARWHEPVGDTTLDGVEVQVATPMNAGNLVHAPVIVQGSAVQQPDGSAVVVQGVPTRAASFSGAPPIRAARQLSDRANRTRRHVAPDGSIVKWTCVFLTLIIISAMIWLPVQAKVTDNNAIWYIVLPLFLVGGFLATLLGQPKGGKKMGEADKCLLWGGLIFIWIGSYMALPATVKQNIEEVRGLSVLEWNTTDIEQRYFTDGYVENLWQARGQTKYRCGDDMCKPDYFISPVFRNSSCVIHKQTSAAGCPYVEDMTEAAAQSNSTACELSPQSNSTDCEVLFIALSEDRIDTTTGTCKGGSGGLCAYQSKWTCGGNSEGDPFGDDCGPRSLCKYTLAPLMADVPSVEALCQYPMYQIGDSEEEGKKDFTTASYIFFGGFGLLVGQLTTAGFRK